jgi:transposase
MGPSDARTLAPVVQNYLRQRAIYLREQGETFGAIAAFLGVHRDTVSDWWKAYQEFGEAALTQQQRGRKVGDGKWLSAEQSQALRDWLSEFYPEDFSIDSALWTRRALQALIIQKYDIEIPLRTLSDYLHEWGFSNQKPMMRAYQQSAEAVGDWMMSEYPAIEAQAKQEKAEIHWGDQAGLATQDIGGKGFAPIGQTPVLRTKRHRTRVNYMATVSAQGTVRFKIYTCKFESKLMIEFLRRLVAGAHRKIFLILDRHPVHRSQAVQDWLEAHASEIQVFFLPSYSPDLNPAEYLNCDVKAAIHSKPPTLSVQALERRVLSHLRRLQKLTARVKKYFKHDAIAYAANG